MLCGRLQCSGWEENSEERGSQLTSGSPGCHWCTGSRLPREMAEKKRRERDGVTLASNTITRREKERHTSRSICFSEVTAEHRFHHFLLSLLLPMLLLLSSHSQSPLPSSTGFAFTRRNRSKSRHSSPVPPPLLKQHKATSKIRRPPRYLGDSGERPWGETLSKQRPTKRVHTVHSAL